MSNMHHKVPNHVPWRDTGYLVFLSIMAGAAEEDGDALMVARIETVNLLWVCVWGGCKCVYQFSVAKRFKDISL